MEDNFYIYLSKNGNNASFLSWQPPNNNILTFSENDAFEVGLKQVILPNKIPNIDSLHDMLDISPASINWDTRTINHKWNTSIPEGLYTPQCYAEELNKLWDKQFGVTMDPLDQFRDRIFYDKCAKKFYMLHYSPRSALIIPSVHLRKALGIPENAVHTLRDQDGNEVSGCYWIPRSNNAYNTPVKHYFPLTANFEGPDDRVIYAQGNMIYQTLHDSPYLNTVLQQVCFEEPDENAVVIERILNNPNYIKVRPGTYRNFTLRLLAKDGNDIHTPIGSFSFATLHFRRIGT